MNLSCEKFQPLLKCIWIAYKGLRASVFAFLNLRTNVVRVTVQNVRIELQVTSNASGILRKNTM